MPKKAEKNDPLDKLTIVGQGFDEFGGRYLKLKVKKLGTQPTGVFDGRHSRAKTTVSRTL